MAEPPTEPIDEARAPEHGQAPPPGRADGTVTRLLSRRLGPVSAVVSEVAFAGGFHVDNSSPRDRLLIALEEVGDRVQAHDSPHSPRHAPDMAHRMYVAPAGAPFWTFSEAPLFLRYLTLSYAKADLEGLAEGAYQLPDSPRFAFFDPRLLALARRAEAECQRRGPSDPLLGDHLALTMLAGLARSDRAPSRQPFRGGLTARQVRIVTDYLESHLVETVDTPDLARLTGLSASHFHRAFRASMGRPPHRWLTERRIQRARELLLRTQMPLVEIALATGFADQPHFTRSFSKLVGVSPGAWRRTVA